MPGVIATIPRVQFSNAIGLPMSGGTLTVYLAGTTTPTNTWQNLALTTANTNPISLDSRGECVLWLDSTVVYKFVLKNALGVTQWTEDNISGAASNLAAPGGAGLVGANIYQTQDALNKERVSVNRFGADPKGLVDSTAAISAAMSVSRAVHLDADGIYLFSQLSIPNGVTLFSEGAILRCSTTSTAIQIFNNSDVALSGITFELKNNPGIWISQDSKNITIDSCKFRPIIGNATGQVIYLGDCRDVTVRDCHFTKCGYQIIQESGKRPVNIKITGNRFIDNFNDSVLQNNDFSGGVAENWVCTGNTVDQSGNGLAYGLTECRGIGFTSIIGGVISNNTFLAVKGDAATHLENVNECIITSNVYKDCYTDIFHTGTAGRSVLYVSLSVVAAFTGTITFSVGGTAAIIWFDAKTNRASIGPITGIYTDGDTFTTTGGAVGTSRNREFAKVSARISNNLFYKSTDTANTPQCILLNQNNDDSSSIIISDNTFNSDGHNGFPVTAIATGFCYGATITGNVFKGFYYGIVGGTTNTALAKIKITDNMFRRNVFNIYNQGQSSDLIIDGNTFTDGQTALLLSTSATNGITRTAFTNNNIQGGVLTLESANYANNRYYNNNLAAGVTKAVNQIIFEIFLDVMQVKKLSQVIGTIPVGGTWATGNLASTTLTGFAIDPVLVPYNAVYFVHPRPDSLPNSSGVIITATSNGVSGQVLVGMANASGAPKTVGTGGYINFAVTQMVF